MYSVIAPAAACDSQHGHRPDNANQDNKKNDLKLIRTSEKVPGEQEVLQSEDASGIAAKILQLHAAADDEKASAAKEPKLVDSHDDTAFEMPGVLRRSRETGTTFGPQPEIVPTPALRSGTPKFLRNGPSLKALIIGALLVTTAGGTAMVFGMTGVLQQEETNPLSVATESIAAEPTIESIIAASNSQASASGQTISGSQPPAGNQETAEVTSATPQQIAKAKDRIRKAFAAGNASTPAPVTQTLSNSDSPVNSLANTAQARLEQQLIAGQSSSAAARSTSSLPILASTSRTVPIPQGLAPAPTVAPPPQAQEQASAKPTDLQQTDQVNESLAAVPSDPAFPNSATTSASVNLRQSEDKNATILAVIPENTSVQYSECGKWWCSVSYDGKSGYVGQRYLERAAQEN